MAKKEPILTWLRPPRSKGKAGFMPHGRSRENDMRFHGHRFFCFAFSCSAFKGRLRDIDEKGTWLHLTFDVKDVLRISRTKKITKSTKRIKFAKKAECDCPRVAGKVDTDFLIMGNDRGLKGASKVVMGESVFVKEWPSKGPESNLFKQLLRMLTDGCP